MKWKVIRIDKRINRTTEVIGTYEEVQAQLDIWYEKDTIDAKVEYTHSRVAERKGELRYGMYFVVELIDTYAKTTKESIRVEGFKEVQQLVARWEKEYSEDPYMKYVISKADEDLETGRGIS